jgi:hypothetical protein
MADDWEAVLAQSLVDARRGMVKGVTESTRELSGLSGDVVPYDQGDLDRSRRETVTESGDEVTGVVSYDQAPYDVIQHEDETLRHDPGRQDHYLEEPFVTHGPRLLQHMADEIGRALGG